MHLSAVERVVPRPESRLEGRDRVLVRAAVQVEVVVADDLKERDARRGDRALVLRVERQVVIHDVAAGDAEDVAITQGADGLADVRHRLRVQARHLEGVLRLSVGEEEEGVARVVHPEPLQCEAGVGVAAPVRLDGLVQAPGARLVDRHLEPCREPHRHEPRPRVGEKV